jgi:hypothetical protein
MQASSAVKDSDGGLNWRQRKKVVARRQQEMQRRQQLVDAYVEALGGPDRVTAIQMTDIERAVDLTLMAAELRTAVRQGSAKVSDLTRLEGAADRATRRLNLPPPGSAAPSDDAWRKFLASHEGGE